LTPSEPSTASSATNREAFNRRQAELLVKSCPINRDGSGPDERVLVAAAYQLFQRYPVEVIDRVCDPATGVASRQRYGLIVSDIARALEDEMAPLRRRQERDRRARESNRLLAPDTDTVHALPPEQRDAAIARMEAAWEATKAKLSGRDKRPSVADEQAAAEAALREHYALRNVAVTIGDELMGKLRRLRAEYEDEDAVQAARSNPPADPAGDAMAEFSSTGADSDATD
jgi:hypothetical protein